MNCLNTVIPESSPEGTCTLFFTTMYYGDVWKDVKPEEYKKLKIKIAGEIIENCEKALHLTLKPLHRRNRNCSAAYICEILDDSKGNALWIPV